MGGERTETVQLTDSNRLDFVSQIAYMLQKKKVPLQWGDQESSPEQVTKLRGHYHKVIRSTFHHA